MFPVASIIGAGWLLLFVVLLIAPPSPGPLEGGGQGEGRTARRGRTRMPEPADQERAVTNGLPDPADLVLEAEAAAILGGKVRGHHLDGALGRTMVWQPPSTGRPMLRVEVRHAADARRVTVSALTALISIHGSVHIAAEASLAGLLPVVEGRLRELARRIDFNQY